MDNRLQGIKEIISPIASEYGVKAVYLFGSYARNQATASSDYDFYIDKGAIRNLFQMAGFRLALEKALQIPVDIVTNGVRDMKLLSEIEKDKVLLYEAS